MSRISRLSEIVIYYDVSDNTRSNTPNSRVLKKKKLKIDTNSLNGSSYKSCSREVPRVKSDYPRDLPLAKFPDKF